MLDACANDLYKSRGLCQLSCTLRSVGISFVDYYYNRRKVFRPIFANRGRIAMIGFQGKVEEAANSIKIYLEHEPVVGLILGTGLGGIVENMRKAVVVPYANIPHYPACTVPVTTAGSYTACGRENRSLPWMAAFTSMKAFRLSRFRSLSGSFGHSARKRS